MNEEKDIKKNQIIIVEGKTDTQKLKKIYGQDIKTIETNGLGISQKTLEFIKKLNDNNEVIIFTDPDGPGKKIRETIVNYLGDKTLNAFITKTDINSKSKKIGIAEADDQAIKDALKNLLTFDKENETLSWSDYLNNNFYLKSNRQLICKHFSWNEKTSSKTLFKWMNWINLTVEDIKKILGE